LRCDAGQESLSVAPLRVQVACHHLGKPGGPDDVDTVEARKWLCGGGLHRIPTELLLPRNGSGRTGMQVAGARLVPDEEMLGSSLVGGSHTGAVRRIGARGDLLRVTPKYLGDGLRSLLPIGHLWHSPP